MADIVVSAHAPRHVPLKKIWPDEDPQNKLKFDMDIRSYTVETIRSLDDFIWEHTNKARILFVVSGGYGFSCQAPIIRALKKQNTAVHTTFDDSNKRHGFNFSNAEEKDLFNELYIEPQRASYKKWHMVVNTHVNGFYPKRNALRIYMHHGPGFGIQGAKIAIAEKHDIFFGLSNFERRVFERKKPGIFSGNKAFFPIGFPKDDQVADHASDRQRLLNSLHLPDRPCVLITSHWQKESTLQTFGSSVFRTLVESMPDYNIIQTGHPWLWSPNDKIDRNWQNALLADCTALDKNYGNAHFLPDTPAEQLVQIADLLVADHSSIMTTFSLLDRPIVFFDNPRLEFAIDEIKDLYLDASHPFQKMEDLVGACRHALSFPDEKRPGRARMQDAFHSNFGTAGTVAADILTAIGTVSSTKTKKWQRVLSLAESHADS